MTKNIKLSLTFLFASMFILLLVMTIGEGLTGFLFILGLYAVLGIVAAVIFCRIRSSSEIEKPLNRHAHFSKSSVLVPSKTRGPPCWN